MSERSRSREARNIGLGIGAVGMTVLVAVGVRHVTFDETLAQYDRQARAYLADHSIPACASEGQYPCVKEVDPPNSVSIAVSLGQQQSVYCEFVQTEKPGCYLGEGEKGLITGPEAFQNQVAGKD